MSKRASRVGLTLFLLGIVAFCFLLTFGIAPYLREAAARSDAFSMLGRCMEVRSADTLVIEQNDERRLVRLVGIEAPRLEGDPLLAAQAQARQVDVHWLARQGQVSRNTLAAWIYRRGLHLTYPFGEDVVDEEGRHLVYAAVAGVDIARKLLQGGQVFASDEEHPRREEYLALEAEGRASQGGLWRPEPSAGLVQ